LKYSFELNSVADVILKIYCAFNLFPSIFGQTSFQRRIVSIWKHPIRYC